MIKIKKNNLEKKSNLVQENDLFVNEWLPQDYLLIVEDFDNDEYNQYRYVHQDYVLLQELLNDLHD